jgi:MoxR-like ATPase
MREAAGLSTDFPTTHLSRVSQLEAAVESVIRGKDDVVRLAVACLLARGHLLIEDVPGVGKTTLAHALARAVSCEFHRLQCTTDMLPSDILGVSIYNAHSGEFEFKRGPVFTNFLLADEINRATPKTQSALLEAMNEGQVTVDGRTWPLERPFMVIATQNPVEHHGTYPLPESQLDRFLMRIRIGYPDAASEKLIMRSSDPAAAEHVAPVISREEVTMLQAATASATVDDSLADYILAFVERTRNHPGLVLGVSPRGAQMIYRASQAMAVVEGRDYVLPDDIKRVILPVCAHRVTLDRRASVMPRSADSVERLLSEILTEIDVPL